MLKKNTNIALPRVTRQPRSTERVRKELGEMDGCADYSDGACPPPHVNATVALSSDQVLPVGAERSTADLSSIVKSPEGTISLHIPEHEVSVSRCRNEIAVQRIYGDTRSETATTKRALSQSA